MKKIKLYNNTVISLRLLRTVTFVVLSAYLLSGCEETKRFEISGADSTPPSAPVFITSKPLPGGARIFYQRPADEDLLSVEASYTNSSGKAVHFAASYFTDSLDVFGLGSSGQHTIEIYAVDRSGNQSEHIRQTVTALESAVELAAQSVRVLPSFDAIIIKWADSLKENIYVYATLDYVQDGEQLNHTGVFTSNQPDVTVPIDLVTQNPVVVKIRVEDKYGNSTLAKDTTINLLQDGVIAKSGWTLPPPGEFMGVLQADGNYNGGEMSKVIDGLTEEDILRNFYLTNESNPWNIIIDLGEKYELSRIITHQRYTWTDTDVRGAYYRGDNVLAYQMYVWNEEELEWEYVSRHTIAVPSVKQESDYKMLGDAGDGAFLYPEEPKFSTATRYFRFEAVTGEYISEITLYGRKAR
ncbi:MAG: DUF4959 domain-containing protein [Tannerella sp.]|jgi:uncharacterized protein affecting Mg2+/Co2+ transport|nr:DUF4959 domain-containing protein [Tannerella sp.]